MWSDEDKSFVIDGVSRLGWILLKRFSAVYKPSEVLAAFSCLSQTDFSRLRQISFGLSDECAAFVHNHVPAFIKILPAGAQHTFDDSTGAPRGRIDWPKTNARRLQAGGDTSRFVTRTIERTVDTTAARLIAFLLEKIVTNARGLQHANIPEIAQAVISNNLQAATRALAILRGRGISTGRRPSARELGSLRKSRRIDISSAVLFYDIYVGLIELANENLLRNLLRQRQMAPEDLDDLFEVWTLLTIVQNFLASGWVLEDALLIGGEGSAKKPKFRLSNGVQTLEIHYQAVPPEMGKVSTYKAIFSRYDLDASMRRPDITLCLTDADNVRHHHIVEVKRTTDKGYILDSVYKVLGYISDFKHCIGPNAPLATLVVWDGIARQEGSDHPDLLQILTARELQESLVCL